MDERPADETHDTDDTEARWRAIVANYGERAEVGPDEYADDDVAALTPETAEPAYDPDVEPDLYLDDDERFVPPPVPPLPRTTPGRFIAWLGALGSPAIVVILLLAQVGVPRLLGWALIAAFVGGFGYLVATMPSEPRDPWDDGSRV